MVAALTHRGVCDGRAKGRAASRLDELGNHTEVAAHFASSRLRKSCSRTPPGPLYCPDVCDPHTPSRPN